MTWVRLEQKTPKIQNASVFLTSPIAGFPVAHLPVGHPFLVLRVPPGSSWVAKIPMEHIFFLYVICRLYLILCIGPSHFAPVAPWYFFPTHYHMHHDQLFTLWMLPLYVYVVWYDICHPSSPSETASTSDFVTISSKEMLTYLNFLFPQPYSS